LSWLEASLLGVLQGLTEFLPVSSSGHLVLGQSLLGVCQPGITFEIVVHLGTLVAVLAVYGGAVGRILGGLARRRRDDLRKAAVLLLASVPAGLVGFLLRNAIEPAFSSPLIASVMLLATGAILRLNLIADRDGSRRRADWPGPLAGLCVGVAQALAVLPGISRSGATITAGRLLGLDRESSAEFSFLLALPAIAGAALADLPGADFRSMSIVKVLLPGFGLSLLTGYAALRVLLGFVRKGRLHLFSWYCWAVGAAGICWWLIAG
jgi:undecaprenyl-diphosphatase